MWPLLKDYMLKENIGAADETHFMCSYCKHLIKLNKMPSRCILNGLHVVEVPPELSRLDCPSKQFIQLAKTYLKFPHTTLSKLVKARCSSFHCL